MAREPDPFEMWSYVFWAVLVTMAASMVLILVGAILQVEWLLRDAGYTLVGCLFAEGPLLVIGEIVS